MKYLRPIRLKLSYYTDIERAINRIFFDAFFRPILEAFKENNYKPVLLQNAKDPIGKALRRGEIIFIDNKFTGKFDSEITKEFKRLGATFNAKDKSWKFKIIPPNLQVSIVDIQMRMEKIKSKILDNLNNVRINKEIIHSRIIKEYKRTVKKVNDDFLRSVKNVTIAPELTPQMQENIAKAWGKNLELYIKSWTVENITKLREEIATNTYHGYRAEGFVKNIQQDYGVSKRKAKFLARQETSLLVSNLREERYKDAGITKYKWSGSMDERERPDHKLLEDTIQTWDNPPIIDRKTARRGHPGEDFGCRCVAIPIVD